MTLAGGSPPIPAFGERLAGSVAQRSSQLVLGLDPDPNRLWPRAIELATGTGPAAGGGPAARHGGGPPSPAERAARAVAIHCELVIDAVAQHCVAVKLQLACFERLGAPGWEALAQAAEHAREHGLLVIADAKRGDIDVSSLAYGQALFGGLDTPFGHVPGLRADAITANPLLGAETLEPMLTQARASGGGVFVLVRTSNPGATQLQDELLAGGETVSERLAAIVGELQGAGPLGDVGAVVGATAPERLARLRELMPSAPFLLPGVGAQGGRVEDLAPAFAPGAAGGLVSASRGLVDAHRRGSDTGAGGDPARAAADEAAHLRELAWGLAS